MLGRLALTCVLWVPQDFTTGCSLEAQRFEQSLSEFKARPLRCIAPPRRAVTPPPSPARLTAP